MNTLSRQLCSVNKWRHLDFQGRDPVVVFLGSAELAVVAPERPAGFRLKLLRALITRQPASIVYLGHECDLLDIGGVFLWTSGTLQGLTDNIAFRVPPFAQAFVFQLER